jgi:hypothetical protein
MSLEATQPYKVSIPVSAALAQALWNEVHAAGAATQYTFVALNSSGQADLPASATDFFIGVIQNRPVVNAQGASQAGGVPGEIVVMGVTKIVAGGTITPGEYIGPLSTGKAQAVTAQGFGASYVQATKKILGQVYPAAGITSFASGDIASAMVNCLQPIPGT